MLDKALALLTMGDIKDAERDIDTVLNQYPDLNLARYLKALAVYLQEGPEPAQESIQSALNLVPDYPPSMLLAGTIAYQLGQFNQAEEYLHRYWLKNPGNVSAVKLLGSTLLKQKKPSDAS